MASWLNQRQDLRRQHPAQLGIAVLVDELNAGSAARATPGRTAAGPAPSNPTLTFLRTPTTSTIAIWFSRSTNSTTCPGMARHIVLSTCSGWSLARSNHQFQIA